MLKMKTVLLRPMCMITDIDICRVFERYTPLKKLCSLNNRDSTQKGEQMSEKL